MNPLQLNHGFPEQAAAGTIPVRDRRGRFRLRHNPSRCLALILCFLCLLTGCNSSDESAAPEAVGSGVTAQEILLGSSLALKGHASFLGTQTFRGAMSYLNYINEQGGVHGRTIKLVAYDDSYDPPMILVTLLRGIPIGCGCFTSVEEPLGWGTLWRDLLWLAMTLQVYFFPSAL
jgi:hypothetical protein